MRNCAAANGGSRRADGKHGRAGRGAGDQRELAAGVDAGAPRHGVAAAPLDLAADLGIAAPPPGRRGGSGAGRRAIPPRARA